MPRSTSSSLSSTRMLVRSGISAMAAPVQALSPSLKGGGVEPNEPEARKFGRMLRMPSMGARITMFDRYPLARPVSRTVLSLRCCKRSC